MVSTVDVAVATTVVTFVSVDVVSTSLTSTATGAAP